jgi:predicted component of type VI protein secretion system
MSVPGLSVWEPAGPAAIASALLDGSGRRVSTSKLCGSRVGIIMNVKLLVVHGRPQGKCLVFPRGEFVFGRGAECHIRPNSDWVSRQHCLLRVTDEALYLRDLCSRNGTLVNGVRVVGERCLAHGDHLQVGPLVFEVHLEATETAEAQAVPRGSEETGFYVQDTGEMGTLRAVSPSEPTTEPQIASFSPLTVTPAAAPEANAPRRPAVS